MNRSGFRNSIALAAVAILAAASLAVAQEETGNVHVVVSDPEGSRLPGVSAALDCGAGIQTQFTDGQGQARFLALDPGNCMLTLQLDGFGPLEYPAVNVRVASNTSVKAVMTPAITETITVTRESPLLDEKKIQQGTTISQIELEKIPTARDPWSVLSQTPGVMVDRINVGGNESGQQSTFTGPGVSDDENAFLVDGVEVTDMAAIGASPGYYDFDQFTEMQFSTGGTDVTKSAAGVSVNLVTKRGTNEFRGSARILRTDSNAFDVFTQTINVLESGNADLASNQPSFVGNSIRQITEYGLEAGGPVMRDKLWFWGSFGNNDIRNRTGGTTLADVQSDDTVLESTAFKFNASLTGSNSAQGSWNNGDKQKFGRDASPTRPQATAFNQRGPTAILKFEDTHVFNSNLFLGGTWAKVDGGFSLLCIACAGAGSLEATPEATWNADGVWQNSFLSGGNSRPSEEIKIDGNYFFNTGSTNHEIKFGARERQFDTISPFAWPGRDVFHVDLGLFGVPGNIEYVVAHRGFTPPVSQEYTSLWAQDTISAGDWTVNVGLRLDQQEGFNEAFAVDANPAFPDILPAVSINGIDPGFSWETVSPRVGVTYALGEENKTLLRASFAQFPEQLETSDIQHVNPLGFAYAYMVFEDANGDLLYQEDETVLGLDGATNFDPSNPGSAVSPNKIQDGLDAPLTDEILLSVEHAFLPEFVAGFNVTLRNTSDLLSLEREMIVDPVTGQTRVATAADFAQDGTVSGTLPDGSTYNEPVFAIACGSACRTGGTLLENTDRDIEYQGYGVNFIKRLSNRWMVRGYFNYGDAEYKLGSAYVANADPNNAEGGFDDQGGLFAVQAAGSGAKQDVFLQSTYQWNLNGMYQVAPDRPWGFNVAANLFGREGTPLPYYHRARQSDGIRRDIQVTSGVDSFRSDDVNTVDLRLEKEFAATGNVGFTVSLDAFNLLDEGFELQRRRQTNTGNFDWVTETLSPRIFRLGVRLNWR